MKPHLILLDFERSPSMLDVDKLLSIADHFASPPFHIDEGRPLVVLASMWVRTSVFARACRSRGVDIICPMPITHESMYFLLGMCWDS